MMITDIWKKTNKSICQIIHFKDGKRIAAGTGFKIDKFIITNNHVYNPTNSDEIKIQFKEENGIKVSLEKTYTQAELIGLLHDGLPQDSWDFAVLKGEHFDQIPSLNLCKPDYNIEVGENCVFLGFPFNSNFLSIHNAIISAKYSNNADVKYIQLDANVNKGNSGGPLIVPGTCEIIGYVTLKKTGFSEKFQSLKKSFVDNIEAIENTKGANMRIGAIDLLQSFKAIQQQFNILGEEMERASNVGIGIAFELDEVRKRIT